MRSALRPPPVSCGELTRRLLPATTGIFGYASTHEYLFGIFEFAPVILSILIWGAFPVKSYIDRMIVRREAMGV